LRRSNPQCQGGDCFAPLAMTDTLILRKPYCPISDSHFEPIIVRPSQSTVPFVLGPKPWVLETQDQGDPGLDTVLDSVQCSVQCKLDHNENCCCPIKSSSPGLTACILYAKITVSVTGGEQNEKASTSSRRFGRFLVQKRVSTGYKAANGVNRNLSTRALRGSKARS